VTRLARAKHVRQPVANEIRAGLLIVDADRRGRSGLLPVVRSIDPGRAAGRGPSAESRDLVARKRPGVRRPARAAGGDRHGGRVAHRRDLVTRLAPRVDLPAAVGASIRAGAVGDRQAGPGAVAPVANEIRAGLLIVDADRRGRSGLLPVVRSIDAGRAAGRGPSAESRDLVARKRPGRGPSTCPRSRRRSPRRPSCSPSRPGDQAGPRVDLPAAVGASIQTRRP
jgi:hypothetical protein